MMSPRGLSIDALPARRWPALSAPTCATFVLMPRPGARRCARSSVQLSACLPCRPLPKEDKLLYVEATHLHTNRQLLANCNMVR